MVGKFQNVITFKTVFSKLIDPCLVTHAQIYKLCVAQFHWAFVIRQ